MFFTTNPFSKIWKRSTIKIKQKTHIFIQSVKKADSLKEIPGIKKLAGFRDYDRIRIASYRIGFKVVEERIVLIAFKHRKDIYKKFP